MGKPYKTTDSIKKMTVKQREGLSDILSGKTKPDSLKAKDLLENPTVAITFEAIMNERGLTDHKLARKLNDILNRKPTEGTTAAGKHYTNQTAIDANSINIIRMCLQAKGKFVDKHEHSVSGLENIPDSQLDKIIKSGIDLVGGRKLASDTGADNN